MHWTRNHDAFDRLFPYMDLDKGHIIYIKPISCAYGFYPSIIQDSRIASQKSQGCLMLFDGFCIPVPNFKH